MCAARLVGSRRPDVCHQFQASQLAITVLLRIWADCADMMLPANHDVMVVYIQLVRLSQRFEFLSQLQRQL